MPEGSVPTISFIVSAYNRPEMLLVILSSLAVQTFRNFEVIVTDNSTDRRISKRHAEIVKLFPGFKYLRTAGKLKVQDCYWAAEHAVKQAHGQWLCFPCDDTYYAPEFAARMLAAAHSNCWNMVICKQVIVGPEASGGSGYRVWQMKPGYAVKTSFIVNRDVFRGFTGKPQGPFPVGADYFETGQLAARIPWGFVDEAMVVHN